MSALDTRACPSNPVCNPVGPTSESRKNVGSPRNKHLLLRHTVEKSFQIKCPRYYVQSLIHTLMDHSLVTMAAPTSSIPRANWSLLQQSLASTYTIRGWKDKWRILSDRYHLETGTKKSQTKPICFSLNV